MKTSDKGISFIKDYEKFSATPYPDQKGVITWGYGHAKKHGERVPAVISQEDALELLHNDLYDAEQAVNHSLERDVAQYQFDACVSMAFNCGSAAFSSSTLLKLINSGNMMAAAQQFTRWNKVKLNTTYVVSNGLSARREAEKKMFESGVYNSKH